MAAQVYRIDSFRQSGFALWDFQWYGGHWTLSYSVLYPALASFAGVAAVAVISAAMATLSFDRLARDHFGPGPGVIVASVVFAVGTLVPSSIGQLPFLTGEAFGLGAIWAASRGRWWIAAGLAFGASLSSPLAGGFVAMAAVAWFLSRPRAVHRLPRALRAALLVTAAAAPVIVLAILFPGQGSMPYPAEDYAWELVVAATLFLLAGREQPVIRAGAVVFIVAASAAFVIPSPVGGNVGRIEDAVAFPLAVVLVWSRPRLLLPIVAIPLALSQWGPAWNAIAGPVQPSTSRPYFKPLDAALARLSRAGPSGRVEVVPTADHWEAVYVPPVMPLARGWERQLDVAENPIFYQSGSLTATSYRAWLLNNGVRFVALPEAPLDPAGKAEAKVVRSGEVPGLQLAWQSANWRLYSVAASGGIVAKPARLVSVDHGQVVVEAPSAGSVLVRVRFSPDWTISEGQGCVMRSADSWITVEVPSPEQFSLRLTPFHPREDACHPLSTPGSDLIPVP
jgi:hypothetical protein